MAVRRLLFSQRRILRLLLVFSVSLLLASTAWIYYQSSGHLRPIAMPNDYTAPKPRAHPIDYLMKKADARAALLMSKETKDLASAAQSYRQRRGRHPPPGFDRWFQFARDHNALIIEDFFDQIYHDLNPFWATKAKEIRQQAKHFANRISVRKGITTKTIEAKFDRPSGNDYSSVQKQWVDLWFNMTTTIQDWLPDVDIPVNVMNESRVIVPWEKIEQYIDKERKSREIKPPSQVLSQLNGLSSLDAAPGSPAVVEWSQSGEPWDMARIGCAPDSLGREATAITEFGGPPPKSFGFPKGSFEGYIQNWTAARDPCLKPEVRGLHGIFVGPSAQVTTNSLTPIFGGAKLRMNNDILIPSAMSWSDDPFESNAIRHGVDWEKKIPKLMWRGPATGGRNRRHNWTRFHRHRFVSMVNGTSVQSAESNPAQPGIGPNFVLPSPRTYRLTSTQYMDLGVWLDHIADAGIVDLYCYPRARGLGCPYTDPYYKIKPQMKPKDYFKYKYIPDLDDNSQSNQFRGLLRSTSLPIKATLYSEWHDSRLIPWRHFVPMDNSFVDTYGILDYFMGTGVQFKTNESEIVTEGAHDDAAQKIALEGKSWAERVLRKEDMLIYMMRLLMEYARICDDQREKLGFVDDLKEANE